jgi:hypothetical protein
MLIGFISMLIGFISMLIGFISMLIRFDSSKLLSLNLDHYLNSCLGAFVAGH